MHCDPEECHKSGIHHVTVFCTLTHKLGSAERRICSPSIMPLIVAHNAHGLIINIHIHVIFFRLLRQHNRGSLVMCELSDTQGQLQHCKMPIAQISKQWHMIVYTCR